MLAETPSVTTSIGAEGIGNEDTWPGFIANSSAEIIEAAIRLYEDETLWLTAQENARHVLSSGFDAARWGSVLIEQINTVRDNLQDHRTNNFTGAMLRHHKSRSTEFMSRWIELKNQL